MATPARPATPSCAMLVDAPLEEDEGEGEEDDEGVDGVVVPPLCAWSDNDNHNYAS